MPAADEVLLVDCVRSALARSTADEWTVRVGDPWCHVDPPGERIRAQGWKLHISATPLSAPLVLARSADVLIRYDCPFKFAGTIRHVQALVSRSVERSVGGKFITAYFEGDDDGLRALADELDLVTTGLPGPGILSDRRYRPESLVHYRFGVFKGEPALGNDGSYQVMLVAPDGSRTPDRRTTCFSPPPWARDPFAPKPSSLHGPNGATPPEALLGGRYLVRQVLNSSYPGDVHRATDQHTGAQVVIKQARPHTGGDTTGLDMRDVRRHEAEMLRRFESSGATAHLVDLIERQGELFLVQQEVAGVTLRQWAAANSRRGDKDTWGPEPSEARHIARGLVDLLAMVHDRRLVVRDFKPSNVMVTDELDLRLIDLELLADPGERVRRIGTPGYEAPEQTSAPEIGPAPDCSADLYSLGATLFCLVSGTDPLLHPDEPRTRTHQERVAAWLDRLSTGNDAARLFAPIIVPLLDEDPLRRPPLAAVRQFLTDEDGAAARHVTRPAGHFTDTALDRMITDATEQLLATMDPDKEWLWRPAELAATGDPINVHNGAAGGLAVLTRAHEAVPDPALREAVAAAAGWIDSRVDHEPRVLPGLYFGRSGTAWALLEAARALGEPRLLSRAADTARRIPISWPNPGICHGMAGAGLTQLRFWEATGHPDFLVRTRGTADALAKAAESKDGLLTWPIPRDFASALAGLTHYGFAHGVAGIGAFLLAAGRATGESRYLEPAEAAAETLSVARSDRGAAYWPRGKDRGPGATHWSGGSSGVGTFMMHMWRQNGDPRFGAAAAQAAEAVHRSRWHTGPAQWHGLAGDAEFLLDLAEATAEDRYRSWAEELTVSIYAGHVLRAGRMLPPTGTGTFVVADFSTGLAGVLALLLRLRHGGPRLWLPDKLTRYGFAEM